MQRPGYRRRPAPLPSPQPIPDRPQQDLPEVTRSGAYNHEVRPRHRRHAYRCRAGVLPCPGPRTARRRSELNATPRLPATAQATTLTQSNPSPRSTTDLPEVTRSAAVVIAAPPLDVPEEADPNHQMRLRLLRGIGC